MNNLGSTKPNNFKIGCYRRKSRSSSKKGPNVSRILSRLRRHSQRDRRTGLREASRCWELRGKHNKYKETSMPKGEHFLPTSSKVWPRTTELRTIHLNFILKIIRTSTFNQE